MSALAELSQLCLQSHDSWKGLAAVLKLFLFYQMCRAWFFSFLYHIDDSYHSFVLASDLGVGKKSLLYLLNVDSEAGFFLSKQSALATYLIQNAWVELKATKGINL